MQATETLAVAIVRGMGLKANRLASLLALLAEDQGPERGRKQRLAARLHKKPAQISQWLSGYRTIEEETARELEVRAGKLPGWMDRSRDASDADGALPTFMLSEPTLEQALPVVLGRLPGLDAYTAGQVLQALRSAMEPAPPLERIEADLRRYLSAPRGAAADDQPRKQRPAA